MEFNKYQIEALRTIKHGQTTSELISECGLGLAGEVGEVVEIIKKHLHHGHGLNYEDIIKELGDVLWYLSTLAYALDIPLDMVAHSNIKKLNIRYPNGFNNVDSIYRKN